MTPAIARESPGPAGTAPGPCPGTKSPDCATCPLAAICFGRVN